MAQVLNNLKALIFHQKQIKECWDSLASPAQVVSILGLIPEYHFIKKILLSERHYNPVLVSGLHQFDLLTLDNLRQTILVIRIDHFAQIRSSIQMMKAFLSKKAYDSLIRRCNEVQKLYKDEVERLGITSLQMGKIMRQLKEDISTPMAILSSFGSGIQDFFERVGNRVQASRNQALFDYK